MFINTDILITWGGIAKKYKRGEYIFHEGEEARFYYQIINGSIKMFNTYIDGKEFAQAEFQKGSSFGEPPLFINEVYPSSAIATNDSVIIKLTKEHFFKMLEEYPNLHMKIITLFAKRIFNKATTAREIINNTPEMRIIAFLNSYKKSLNKENEKIIIPYKRQDIANFIGLRVETVIRTLAKMKTNKTVDIVNRKLIY